MYNPHLFTKKPPPFKIYSGKEFIRNLHTGLHGEGKVELIANTDEDDETGEYEENYDLYFPGVDSF